LKELDVNNQAKILEAILCFEKIGTAYNNINNLGDGLFIVCPNVKTYFLFGIFDKFILRLSCPRIINPEDVRKFSWKE
jgi:hypothetical protein